jgi:hypothetical protein
MIIKLGEIQARCPACSGVEFDGPPQSELRTDSELACSGCGSKSNYHDLLEQIGEQAMKQANEALARLKGRKND